MPSNTKPTTKKISTKPKHAVAANAASSASKRKNSELLAIPVAVASIACFVLFLATFGGLQQVVTSPLNLIFMPAVPSLLVSLFGALYVHKVAKKESITMLPMVVASIFTAALVCVIIGLLMIEGGKGNSCPGLFGQQMSCSDTNALVLYVWFANPITFIAGSILAIVGSVSLLKSPK